MKHRVLLIDDQPAIVEMARIILEITGRFEVAGETCPEKAVETAKSFLPDLILLDVAMPGKHGMEVARDFAAEPLLAHRPIVFMTGRVSRGDKKGPLLEYHGTRFLAKPMSPVELVDAVDQVLAVPV